MEGRSTRNAGKKQVQAETESAGIRVVVWSPAEPTSGDSLHLFNSPRGMVFWRRHFSTWPFLRCWFSFAGEMIQYMLVALGVEIAKGNTGFYSDWVALPHFSLASTISRSREPFRLPERPHGTGGGGH